MPIVVVLGRDLTRSVNVPSVAHRVTAITLNVVAAVATTAFAR